MKFGGTKWRMGRCFGKVKRNKAKNVKQRDELYEYGYL